MTDGGAGVRNRWGCFSVTGMVIALVVFVGVVGWTTMSGPGLFSPGGLNSASASRSLGGVSTHAQLGNDCGACHTGPFSGEHMADKCLGCHREVGREISTGTGVHGRLIGAKTSPTCGGCHTEHHGARGELTVTDGRGIPHELTGYSLKSHQRFIQAADLTCAGCHPNGYTKFDQTTCLACHQKLDPAFMSRHVADFGNDCLACHTGSGRDGADFNHDKLPFRLTGKHEGVACKKCHTDMRSAQALKSTPQDCYSCHARKDPHKGAFGKQCDQCHTTATWDDAKFDHKIFPVNHGAEERKATCKTCHPKGTSTYDCYGCHAHTPTNVVRQHEGKRLAELTDCIKCHKGGRGGGD